MFPVGDGRQGFPEEAPYNAIHVGAAAPTMPQAVSTTQLTNKYNSFICYVLISYLFIYYK